MISFYCIHCGQHIEADDDGAGIETSCPTCQGAIQVPGEKRMDVATAVPPPPPAPPSSPAGAPPPPPPPPKRKGPPPVPAGLGMPPPPSAPPPPGFGREPRIVSAYYTNRAQEPREKLGVGPFLSTTFVAWILAFGYQMTQKPLSSKYDDPLSLKGAVPFGDAIAAFASSLGMVATTGALAMIAGSLIGVVFLVFGVPFLKTLRRGYAFSVVGVMMVALFGIHMAKPESPQLSVEAPLASSTAEEVLKIPYLEAPPARNEPAGGEVDPVSELEVRFLTEMDREQAEHITLLGEVDLANLLNAERVSQDRQFRVTWGTLKAARRELERFQTKTQALLDGLPAQLDALAINDADKGELRKSFLQEFEKLRPLLEEAWDLEWSMLDNIEKIVQHLELTQNRWVAKEGQFLFDEEADLNHFNDLIRKLDAEEKRQEAIKAAISSKSKSK